MNKTIAKKIARLVECDLSSESLDKAREISAIGKRLIAQIQPDGNHTEREEIVPMWTTSSNRYLYRQLKKIYKTKQPTEIYEQLLEDLKEM